MKRRDRSNGAFYTPRDIAARMAKALHPTGPAIIVDPACGRGDLLAQVVELYGTRAFRYIGYDRDDRALRKCRDSLAALGASFRLSKRDFLATLPRKTERHGRRVFFIMNPPFKGYGLLSRRRRLELRRSLPEIRGRFNLAHAFILHAVEAYHPRRVVAIMPGTWARSSYGRFLGIGPRISWRMLPESAFPDATTTSGLLVASEPHLVRGGQGQSVSRTFGRIVRVRQGVATGADRVFMRLADTNLPAGSTLPAVRGRDIARGLGIPDLPRIWLPPNGGDGDVQRLVAATPHCDRKVLERRYCVRVRGLSVVAYHEEVPQWFRGTPKVVVPEICARPSILEDPLGLTLPLHSSIAIGVQTRAEVTSLGRTLTSEESWRFLRRVCPRMPGNSVRITTPALKAMLDT